MKLKINKEKMKCIVLIILIYTFVLQNFIQDRLLYSFRYFDEIFTVFALIFYVVNLIKRKCVFTRFEIYILCGVFIIMLLAVISSIQYSKQPISNMLLDLFANLKFPIVLLYSIDCFKEYDISKYKTYIALNVRMITYAFSILTILDLIFDLFPDTYYQFYKNGVKSLRLIYAHPGTLSVVCVFLLAILIYVGDSSFKNIFCKILLAIIMILTFRAKIIGTLAIILGIYLYTTKCKKPISVTKLLPLVPIILLLSWSEIQSYYITNAQASRLILTKTSIQIALDKFPLGTGLASFGSAFSINPYSKVYSDYGISSIWGISEQTAQDISDTFWPMLIGQFGFIAGIIYLIGIILLYKKIQKIWTVNMEAYRAAWSLFIYLLIASTSESAYVNAYAVAFAVFISVFCGTSTNNLLNGKQKSQEDL